MTRRPVCTPAEQKKAMSFWKRYLTHTMEYKSLAESLCVNTAELNAFCSEADRSARQRREAEAASDRLQKRREARTQKGEFR